MHWTLLLLSCFGCAIIGTIITSIARESNRRARKILGVTVGVVFFTIAATSLVLIVNVALAAKETGVKNELSSQTETIILENIGSSGEDKYYATMGGKWVYSYLDSKGDVQIRDVDAECCYKHRGDMNGKAFLSITTTNYEVEYKYLCFVAYRYESAQTYDFYIP